MTAVAAQSLHATIAPRALADALAKLLPLARGANILPVLGCVRISSGHGALHLSATDLDQHLAVRVNAEVRTPGLILAPAAQLAQLAKLAAGSTLTIQDSEGRCVVTSGKSRTRLLSPPVDEWPVAPEVSETTITLPAAPLLDAMARVAFAASSEGFRPILNGVLWELDAGTLRLVATDGHRMAMAERAVDGVSSDRRPIVPARAIEAARKVFSADDETLRVTLDDTRIRIESATATLVARLVEGPYPDYRRVLPKESTIAAIVDRAALLAVVRRVAVLASRDTRKVTLALSADGVIVTASTADAGDATDTAPVEAYTGEPITLGVNASYLLEGLGALATERVQLFLGTPERAVLLCPVDPPPEMGDYRQLLMPMRLLD
ncbi:MAG TPA: DNA polymerase III subunit beta [Gemmatimonadaceae bacterium]|nr:DNA polymerase III subunit beta [Gemmatimonadaceae bacterium]